MERAAWPEAALALVCHEAVAKFARVEDWVAILQPPLNRSPHRHGPARWPVDRKRRRPVRRTECQRVDREGDIRPVVGMEVRQPRAGEVSERAMAKETRERSAPCVYPESESARFDQISGARAVGTGIAVARTQDHEAHVSILPYIAVRFDQVLEVGWFIS